MPTMSQTCPYSILLVVSRGNLAPGPAPCLLQAIFQGWEKHVAILSVPTLIRASDSAKWPCSVREAEHLSVTCASRCPSPHVALPPKSHFHGHQEMISEFMNFIVFELEFL